MESGDAGNGAPPEGDGGGEGGGRETGRSGPAAIGSRAGRGAVPEGEPPRSAFAGAPGRYPG
jgi:hypothetical protein